MVSSVYFVCVRVCVCAYPRYEQCDMVASQSNRKLDKLIEFNNNWY